MRRLLKRVRGFLTRATKALGRAWAVVVVALLAFTILAWLAAVVDEGVAEVLVPVLDLSKRAPESFYSTAAQAAAGLLIAVVVAAGELSKTGCVLFRGEHERWRRLILLLPAGAFVLLASAISGALQALRHCETVNGATTCGNAHRYAQVIVAVWAGLAVLAVQLVLTAVAQYLGDSGTEPPAASDTAEPSAPSK